MHWNGRRWAKVSSPSPGGATSTDILESVVVTSAGSAWAVGSRSVNDIHRELILHWNGRAWQSIAAPSLGDNDVPAAVGASSARNVWTVGTFSAGGHPHALAVHCC